ncbi:hypothetical protein [Amycolatopsis sp. NPDC051903]|uniref:hypothetical protein n=1 Tax=Amycolatopsis sp. NPDC051903 TaxID=3363936 RepID=UPI0037BC3A78
MTANTYRGHGKNGMERFNTWFRPEGIPGFISPSDIDGHLNDKTYDRNLVLELKPVGAVVPNGQVYTAESLTRLKSDSGYPAFEVLHVFDPFADGDLGAGATIEDDEEIVVHWYHRGTRYKQYIMPISKLNDFVSKWWARRLNCECGCYSK